VITKQELHHLIDELPDDDVETVGRILDALTRQQLELAGSGRRPDDFKAQPIRSIDDLDVGFWPDDEPADVFEATIRRWRDAERHG